MPVFLKILETIFILGGVTTLLSLALCDPLDCSNGSPQNPGYPNSNVGREGLDFHARILSTLPDAASSRYRNRDLSSAEFSTSSIP